MIGNGIKAKSNLLLLQNPWDMQFIRSNKKQLMQNKHSLINIQSSNKRYDGVMIGALIVFDITNLHSNNLVQNLLMYCKNESNIQEIA
ncbi:unnamed protein product [Paramecium sonneborni]|uniref:Uncharacterized protein n=1 Tax=Paramecium sonneborni TaxID=65129 RepID=A0A8S1NS13_9CILI|nr:unnamed protein product [Paramecium sonneborni]